MLPPLRKPVWHRFASSTPARSVSVIQHKRRSVYTAAMAHIDKTVPGSFCWMELATTNHNAAKAFYAELFGWTPNDAPMGPGEFYTMFMLDNRHVGAGYTMRKEEQEHGAPPHWNLYIGV